MGGVLRAGHASALYMEGEGHGQKIFHDGNLVWEKPIPSVYPSRGINQTDDALFIGSSDIACLGYSTWSPRDHDWPNVFRNNYLGSLEGDMGGRTRPGMASAVTLGRVTLDQVVENARNGQYDPAVNPFTSLSNYDALVLDTSDIIQGNYQDMYPDAPDYYAITNMPPPFHWPMRHSRQNFLNRELEARMELVRLAHQNGVRKLFLCSPWVRLGNIGESMDDDNVWRFKFGSLEDSMHYQQDRLNFQIKQENLDVHVSLIPFHIIFRDLYDDIVAGTQPAGITSIRNLFALGDNLSNDDPTDPNAPKHWYMLNYLGTYAINCLFDALVFGGDPRTKPRTDGYYTVPQAIATYFQNKAIEIRDNYARGGRSREYTGYVMPKIRDYTPTQILGNNLLLHRSTPAVTGTAYPFLRNAPVGHAIAVFEFDRANIEGGFQRAMTCAGSGQDAVTLGIWLQGDRMSMEAEVLQTLREAVTFNNLDTAVGFNRVMVDIKYPVDGTLDEKLAVNSFMQAVNLEFQTEEYVRENNAFSAVQNPGALAPISNRVIFPDARFICSDVILCQTQMSDEQRFNVFRYLSRKYQAPLWEPLWPDMET